MPKYTDIVFLEDWLKHCSHSSTSSKISYGSGYSSTSAQSIIQAWADLRASFQQGEFTTRQRQSLNLLLHSQASLYVADPQAKLVLSIISSHNLTLPHDSYPLFFRLLYIWLRKSSKPALELVNLAAEIVSRILSSHSDAKRSAALFSESFLLLGALSLVRSVSESTRALCLQLLCRLLEDDYVLIGSVGELVPDVLAGIGYALSVCENVLFVRLLRSFFSIWGKIEKPCDVYHGLMILHLMEWVILGYINEQFQEKIGVFTHEILESPEEIFAPFAVVMAAAGALRACSGSIKHASSNEVISRLRMTAEARLESIASALLPKTVKSMNSSWDPDVSLLLQCISLAMARVGGLTFPRGPLILCLASALLTEIFPLKRFHAKIFEFPFGKFGELKPAEVKKHQDSIIFKDAGAMAGVLCDLYVSVKEEEKFRVENLMWDFCQDVYLGHRQAALMLRGKEDDLLNNLDKVAESAFLMVTVFARAVANHRQAVNSQSEKRVEASVKILVSFSCMEYFRRIRLPEYIETIRAVIVSVQDYESASVAFVESMPTYADLLNYEEYSCLQKMKYIWSNDEVQTARILFYLRVIPTAIERLPCLVFREKVAATMFLYMGYPNAKVARASHSMFVSFISSGKYYNQDERTSLKEQLVFYYVKRSLEAYPGTTPFDGFASGVAALVRHLPAGSPAIYYCIHSLVDRASSLCREAGNQEGELWSSWQGELEPFKRILEILLRLISLVDIQVLPELMKLLAHLIIQFSKDVQNMVLNELYVLVAESDDVTRKPTLVSWLQSLSYICSQVDCRSVISVVGSEEKARTNADTISLPTPISRL